MKDSEHQDGQAVAFPESELTRRLLRRATEPIGVINVRQASELHSRTLWIAQRAELLDNIKNRYGLGQGASNPAGIAAPAMPFVSPLQAMAASSPFDSASMSPSAGRMPVTETLTSTASTVSPAPQYRVKRPHTQAGPSPTQSTARGEIRVSPHTPPAIQRKINETQSSASSTPDASAPPLVLAGEVPAAAEIVPSATPHVSRPASTPEDLPADKAPKLNSSLPQVRELPSIAAAPRMHLQRMPESSPAAGQISHPTNPNVFGVASTPEDLPGRGAPAVSNVSSGDLHVQRTAEHSPALPAIHVPQTAETGTALPPSRSDSQSQRAISPEIRVAPLLPASTSIIWRKADTNGGGRESAAQAPTLTVGPTYTNGPQIMRQPVSQPVSGGGVAAVATAPSGSNRVDLTRMAENVSRIIARQLRIDRERRGRTR
jgi:hypothetical protein